MKPICLPISNGNYFLHHSLLLEASESWLRKREQTNAGIFIMQLIASRIRPLEICACDRTLEKLSKTGHKVAFTPALYDTINKKSMLGYDSLGDDEYTLKVASLTSTLPYPVYIIVADNKKEELRNLALGMGFSIKILSPKDFGL